MGLYLYVLSSQILLCKEVVDVSELVQIVIRYALSEAVVIEEDRHEQLHFRLVFDENEIEQLINGAGYISIKRRGKENAMSLIRKAFKPFGGVTRKEVLESRDRLLPVYNDLADVLLAFDDGQISHRGGQ